MLQKANENKDAHKREVDLMKIRDTSQIVENWSSLHISAITADDYECRDCDYCKPINSQKDQLGPVAGESEKEGAKSDEVYYMGGFSTGKFRIDHFEHALDMGACRSGDFVYFRNQRKSCCEVYNYRLQIDQF